MGTTLSEVGRPRDPRADKAILEATRELLAEAGVSGLSIEAIAARAGVGKATIYRRWSSREEVLLALLAQSARNRRAVEDIGDTRAELVQLVSTTIETFTRTASGIALQGLLVEMARTPRLRDSYREQIVEVRRAETRAVLERGVGRGDLRADLDADLAHALLIGAPLYRLLLSGEPVDVQFAEHVVDAFLAGARRPGLRS